MKTAFNHLKSDSIVCTNCITGETESVSFTGDILVSVNKTDKAESAFFTGSGLVDIQINGIRGIDFNVPSLTVEDIVNATHYLLREGVTSFFPTVITNSDEHIITIMRTIAAACESDLLVEACVGGIHLEGPFISPRPGAKGAHNAAFIKAPDRELFNSFQKAADGRIKIITLAPEWESAPEFIEQCSRSGVIVSIGHSLADTSQIRTAVQSGARMSTHLGNGVPLMLQRHPNLIWDQLAEEELYTCIIADGIHIPDSFIKVVRKVKSDKVLIVSDATRFAGMPPGEYHTHIGGDVVLDENKRVSVKGEPGLLAGAAKSLKENIDALLEHRLCSLGSAWQMASLNVAGFLNACRNGIKDYPNDRVIFIVENNSVRVKTVIKNRKVVFSE